MRFRLGIFALLGVGAVLAGAAASRFAGTRLQTKDGSGWVSTLATANASMGLAGTNPVCTVQ